MRAGLRLGEALARCPTLRLVAPDPAGVADAWERKVRALENIGAAVESGPPGHRLVRRGRVEDAARRDARGRAGRDAPRACAEGRPGSARRPRGSPRSRPRAGRAPRRAEVTPLSAAALAASMAPLPVSLLRTRRRPPPARRAGALRDPHARGAGEAAARVAGRPLRAVRPAGARPRAGQGHAARRAEPAERLEERLELPESASGAQLQHGLGAADRPAARAARAARAGAARGRAHRPARGGRDLARARDLPRAAGRPAADAARAGRCGWASSPRRRTS